MKSRSIRTRFTALTALAIIISVIAVGIVSAQYLRKVANGYLEELLMLKCSNMGKDIEERFMSIEQCVDTVSYHAKTHLPGGAGEEMTECLSDLESLFRAETAGMDGVVGYYFRLDPNVYSDEKGFMYSRDTDGEFTEDEPMDLSLGSADDVGGTDWFYTPRARGRAMWIGPYSIEKAGGTQVISYVEPVFIKSRLVAVAGVDFDYEKLKECTRYEGHFEGAVPFLVDEHEKVITHPELEIGTPLSEISEKLGAAKLPAGHPVLRLEYGGTTYKVTWSRLSNGMMFYLAAPERAVKEHWLVILKRFLVITLCMLAVFAALSIMISGRIAKPLTMLADAAGRINEGDYDFDLVYNGDDEVGTLTNSFRQLTDHLKVYISDLNDMAYKDALTSVRNTGAFEMYRQKLDDLIKAGSHGKRPEFAVCMFDCNNLKDINDNCGHDKGDMFLKNCCALICGVFTHSPVFRIGGDEFVCILQNEDLRNREKLCSEFVSRMKAATKAATEPWDKIDIAAGIAEYDPAIDRTARDVVNRADKNMYENKQRAKEPTNEDVDK